jgi:hypothetical protein
MPHHIDRRDRPLSAGLGSTGLAGIISSQQSEIDQMKVKLRALDR